MSPLGGNDINDVYAAAKNKDFSGLATLGDDNTTSLLGNLLTNEQSAANTAATNAANREIAAMTNAANRELAAQQNKWNLEQWNRQNAYNTPEAQKERFLAAGLNPISMMSGQSSSGNAANLESASLANQIPGAPMESPNLSAPNIHAYSPRGTDIAAALTNVANAGKGFADTLVSLRGVKNAEKAQFSQSKLNFAKALESEQTTKNLKQQHDVITPANLQNIFSEIKQREHQNRNLDEQSELYKSNVMLNDSKRSEINQGIIESLARIDYQRKSLGIQSEQLGINRAALSSSWSGLISRLAEDSGLIKDLTDGLRTIVEVTRGFKTPREKLAAAYDFVTSVGDQAVKSRNETLQLNFSWLRDALPEFLQGIWDRHARLRQNYLNSINSSNSSVLNPSGADSYYGP